MYRIIDNRSSGKTGRLMLLAKETNSTIACLNPEAMRRKAYSYGIVGLNFISYKELLEIPDKTNIMIDELECFTRYCLNGNKLVGYTLSKEE